ncbi:hypothetical protein LR48_Vigan04g020400 [Vigna angularis]|uniref:Hydrophobic seed protein domain-containing protein n=1 Tax=Phaseolus angularis TaxID=3914 RepID=A0A0L9UBF2_PHAAN|nr:uncharacterized protein HKW66_Vig0087580 [Vigna angularis]KOM40006.1 hypothetical protein LR48_Vigan04g020400 [Vigna angularis]
MGLMKYVLAVFLSLSLLSVSMVRSQRLRACPINIDEFSACTSLLNASVSAGLLPLCFPGCCFLLKDLKGFQDTDCLRTAINTGVIVPPTSLPRGRVDLVIDIIIDICRWTDTI